jgi:hypothetical protein
MLMESMCIFLEMTLPEGLLLQELEQGVQYI